MDVFDKILKEHSWKFPKGYPDMNDPKDTVPFIESFIVVNNDWSSSGVKPGIWVKKFFWDKSNLGGFVASAANSPNLSIS